MPRWIAGVGTLFPAILFFTGCGSDSGFTNQDFIPRRGSVQFVNMMPDSPQIRVFHGLSRDDVAFPFTTPIESRAVDQYDWELVYANNAGNRVVITRGENQPITENVLTTFLFMGNIAQASVQIADTPVVPQAERPEGAADIWFAVNSSHHDMLDIYLTALDADLESANLQATVTNGTFTAPVSVPAGTGRQLRIAIAGTDTLLFDSGSMEILQQTQELFAIVDDFGPGSTNHVDVIRTLAESRSIIPDVSQPALVRAGNYTGIENLDVAVGEVSFAGVAPAALSGYQEVAGGERAVTAGSSGTQVEAGMLNIFRGFRQSVLAFTDTENADGTRVLVVRDSARPIVDRSALAFVNGSAQTVDMYALRPGQSTGNVQALINDLGFAGTEPREVFPEPLQFVVTNMDDTETLATLDGTLVAGENYVVIFDAENRLHLIND